MAYGYYNEVLKKWRKLLYLFRR